MATLTPEQYKKMLEQLQFAQEQVNVLKTQVNNPAPTGQKLSAAQLGGASGVGFETPDSQAGISKEVKKKSELGIPKSGAGDSVPSTFSQTQADFALRGAGLSGLIDSKKFVGLKPEDARKKIAEERAKRTSQVSANVSFAFNPETIAGTKKIVDRVGIGINDIVKDTFSSKGTQKDKIQATLEASAKEIASLFTSPEEFAQALQTNPQLQNTMQTFEKLGGNIDNIQSKVQIPRVETEAQTTADFLANISNPTANKEAEQRAIDELIPEREIIQDEIVRQAGIPREIKDLYFGTEETVGLLKMKENQAIEAKRILEQQERDETTSQKAKAKLAIQKLEADKTIQIAKIEQNRLAAKNYMTGMLAKLGALQTTGAAPLALQTLETKYQIQTQTLTNQYEFAEREIKINLSDGLNQIENRTDEEILKLEQDLTKDYETISREILKLQQTSDREIFNLTNKYATELRQRTTVYTNELKREAEKNAKAFAKLAGGGIDLFSLSKSVDGKLSRASKKNPLESSYPKVKRDVKNNLPPALSSKIITELTDEQLQLFTEDYLQERDTRQQSFDPVAFYEQWKKNLNIKQKKDDGVSSKIDDLFD